MTASTNRPDHAPTTTPIKGRIKTPWWYVVVAGVIFFIALGVHSAYAAQNGACTISESSSFATVYETPECNIAFHATDISRWMMVTAGAATIAFTARRIFDR
jgi:hypothetical protein